MQHIRTILMSLCVLFALAASESRAQPDHHRTVIVDPSATGFANQPTIQDGIDAVPPNPAERWTVLIYSGVYNETVTLGNTKENVNLMGVDPDAVVIQPPLGQNGIIIDGVGARNNTIRNLTIHIRDETGTGDNLDGILIKRTLSGDDPSNITIENVTINLDADASRAIRVRETVSDLEIRGVTINCTANAGSAIVFDKASSAVTITDTSMTTTGDDSPAVHFVGQAADITLSGVMLGTTGDGGSARSALPSRLCRLCSGPSTSRRPPAPAASSRSTP